MVGKRFENASLEDFTQELPAVRQFLAELQQQPDNDCFAVEGEPTVPGLVITSDNVGAGKTHLAAAIHNALPRDYPRCFVNSIEILDQAREDVKPWVATYFSNGSTATERDGSWEPLVDRICHSPTLLFLDDFTAIRPTDFALDCLARILRHRYESMATTIITMHSDFDHVSEMFGEAVASRILQFGPVVKVKGGDRRRAALQPGLVT